MKDCMKDYFGFYIYETVDLPIELYRKDGVKGILDGLINVIISFKQGKVLLEKDINSPDVGVDAENDIVNVHMSQEETGTFREGEVGLQINLLYESHERDTSCETLLTAFDNYHKAVME